MLFDVLVILAIAGLVFVWVARGGGPAAPPPPAPAARPATYEPGKVMPIPTLSAGCVHEWVVADRTVLEAPHEQRLVLTLKCPLCGLLSHTAEATAKPPFSRADCVHDWVVDKSSALASAFEQVTAALAKETERTRNGQFAAQKLKFALPEGEVPPQWMFRKTLVQTRTCRKCGECLVTKATNFGDEDAEEGKE